MICNLCGTKSGLNRHLKERRCKITIDLIELNEKINQLERLKTVL